MVFIPKNALRILANKDLQREFFLKPYGLNSPKHCKLPKKGETKRFVNLDMVLHVPKNEVGPNVLVFKGDESISKIEAAQYISKLYALNVEKVHTVRYMPVVTVDKYRKPTLKKAFKKFYVMTGHKFNGQLNNS